MLYLDAEDQIEKYKEKQHSVREELQRTFVVCEIG